MFPQWRWWGFESSGMWRRENWYKNYSQTDDGGTNVCKTCVYKIYQAKRRNIPEESEIQIPNWTSATNFKFLFSTITRCIWSPHKNNNNNNSKSTPCSRARPQKLTCRHQVKKFPAFYGTRRFIITFTKARHFRGFCVWFVKWLSFYGEEFSARNMRTLGSSETSETNRETT